MEFRAVVVTDQPGLLLVVLRLELTAVAALSSADDEYSCRSAYIRVGDSLCVKAT